MSWNPGAEKAPLSFLLLGVVYCHVVIEDHKQEKRHAQHVGEDGELHVRDHPDQLQPTPTLQTHKLESPLELLSLLSADHSHGSCQLPSSRLQPLHRRHWGPESWGTPGPELTTACQPPQELVCLRGDSDSELRP